jgi:hypothetical protein
VAKNPAKEQRVTKSVRVVGQPGSSSPQGRRACGTPEETNRGLTIIEWVAQISILNLGVLLANRSRPEYPGLKKRDLGHPLKVWKLQLFFDRREPQWRDLWSGSSWALNSGRRKPPRSGDAGDNLAILVLSKGAVRYRADSALGGESENYTGHRRIGDYMLI